MIGSNAVATALGDGLQVPETHPPGVLDGTARRLANGNSHVRHVEGRWPGRDIGQFVNDSRHRPTNGPGEGEPTKYVSLVDGGLPRLLLGQEDARFPSELEAASDFRLDPGPPAKPAGKMFDPKQPFKDHRPRCADLHPEIVVERHRGPRESGSDLEEYQVADKP